MAIQSCTIRTSVYPDRQCVSTGGYYDHRQQWHAWEYLGSFVECESVLQRMRDGEDCEFMHVVTRHY